MWSVKLGDIPTTWQSKMGKRAFNLGIVCPMLGTILRVEIFDDFFTWQMRVRPLIDILEVRLFGNEGWIFHPKHQSQFLKPSIFKVASIFIHKIWIGSIIDDYPIHFLDLSSKKSPVSVRSEELVTKGIRHFVTGLGFVPNGIRLLGATEFQKHWIGLRGNLHENPT